MWYEAHTITGSRHKDKYIYISSYRNKICLKTETSRTSRTNWVWSKTTESMVQLQALQIQKHLFIFTMLLNFVPVDISHLSFGACLVLASKEHHSMARYGAWWHVTPVPRITCWESPSFFPPFLHIASNQELKEGEAWKWGYLKTTFTDYQSASILLRTLMKVHRLTVMMEMWRPQLSSVLQNW